MTSREAKILKLYKTHTSKEVGAKMNVSYRTVLRIAKKYKVGKHKYSFVCRWCRHTFESRYKDMSQLDPKCYQTLYGNKCLTCFMDIKAFPDMKSKINKGYCIGCDGSKDESEAMDVYQSPSEAFTIYG